MTDKAEKSIQTLTGTGRSNKGTLSQLLRQCERYAVLETKIQGVVPSRLQTHIQVARVENHTLIMAVSSPTWAALAKLESSTMLQAAQAHWPEPLTDLRVVVAPSIPSEAK